MLGDAQLKCPCCGGRNLIKDNKTGEIVCIDCGSVVCIDNIDLGPEWRAYSEEHEERRKRIGDPLTFLEVNMGIFSVMGTKSDMASMKRRRKIKRMAQIQTRLSPASKKLEKLLNEIKRACEKLSLSRSEMETAARIARKIITSYNKKRWNIKALVVASIYVSCKINENSKKLNEIVKSVSGSSKKRKEVMKLYRMILTKMNMHLPVTTEQKKLNKIAKDLKCDGKVLLISNKIIRCARLARVGLGKTPGSVATAAVYIAHKLLNKKLTQRKICLITKTTEVTLRSRIKDIMDNVSIEVEV
ncbi:hypothetical protein DRN86_01290 [Candidatus Geothermarchaeota archaeon]|nr:MAG: hypothetical protein DRN86_01290 [Candidatus Geothermarchaeota archaeon]